MSTNSQPLPTVAFWRIVVLRILYLLIAAGLTSFVWQQLFLESADWPLMRGIAKSMMGGIALLCIVGIFHPLKTLPIMLFEMLWKTLWLGIIALPAWLNNRWTDDIESVFYESIGILIVYAVIPWNYVWARYIKQSDEPWRPVSGSSSVAERR